MTTSQHWSEQFSTFETESFFPLHKPIILRNLSIRFLDMSVQIFELPIQIIVHRVNLSIEFNSHFMLTQENLLQHRLHFVILSRRKRFLIVGRILISYEVVIALQSLLKLRLLSFVRKVLISCEATPLANSIEAFVPLLLTKPLPLKTSSIDKINLLFFSLFSWFNSLNFCSKLEPTNCQQGDREQNPV